MALILGKAIVGVVEDSEISGESGASAILVKLSGNSVQGTVGARALRSGLVCQANLLSGGIHGSICKAASAVGAIASTAISC